MVILLAKRKESTVNVGKDVISIKRAIDLYKKNSKNMKDPFILTIDGYDVFAIPGTVEECESESQGIIKLNLTEVMDRQEMEFDILDEEML